VSAETSPPYLVFEDAFLRTAIQVPGPETALISEVCAKHEMTVAIGVTERPEKSGTLYNSLLYFGSAGAIVGSHRKLMPTYNEARSSTRKPTSSPDPFTVKKQYSRPT
jgi:nitrilase